VNHRRHVIVDPGTGKFLRYVERAYHGRNASRKWRLHYEWIKQTGQVIIQKSVRHGTRVDGTPMEVATGYEGLFNVYNVQFNEECTLSYDFKNQVTRKEDVL
jgi:hypothetical protein